MNAMEIAAVGLQQDTERLRVLGHNVANISTPGFKRQIATQASFFSVVDAQITASAASSTLHTDLGAGKPVHTGRPLDVALGAREFLLLQGPDGASALQPGGSLHVDGQGRLVNQSGWQVMGRAGALAVPATAGVVRLDAQGQVLADDQAVGTLQVLALAQGARLDALEGGMYAMPRPEDMAPVQAPRAAFGQVEASNVVSSQAMVQLMETVRHAETMTRLIQGSDEILGKAIAKLGELG